MEVIKIKGKIIFILFFFLLLSVLRVDAHPVAVVGRGGAGIFFGPYFSNQYLGQAIAGVQLDVIEQSEDWCKVSLPDGRLAWVHNSQVGVYFSDTTPSLGNNLNILRTAYSFLGAPYLFGGTSRLGFDCSGFVQEVFLLNGLGLPRKASEQFKLGVPVSSKDLLGGDLVFFAGSSQGVSHVGIYWGESYFIHASSSYGVIFTSLGKPYYRLRFIGARRL